MNERCETCNTILDLEDRMEGVCGGCAEEEGQTYDCRGCGEQVARKGASCGRETC
jgi:hypothetical protein